jgi:hypothetical protein
LVRWGTLPPAANRRATRLGVRRFGVGRAEHRASDAFPVIRSCRAKKGEPVASRQSALRRRSSDHFLPRERRLLACAVERRRFPVGASPTRQPLQPVSFVLNSLSALNRRPISRSSRCSISRKAGSIVTISERNPSGMRAPFHRCRFWNLTLKLLDRPETHAGPAHHQQCEAPLRPCSN